MAGRALPTALVHSHLATSPLHLAGCCLSPAQGIEDHFLEQWHQKLHTNTTPEDVTICEAYLAFLRSGSMDEFWCVCVGGGGGLGG